MVSPPLDLCTDYEKRGQTCHSPFLLRRKGNDTSGPFFQAYTDPVLPSFMDPSAEYTKRLDERRRWLVESHRKSHFVATLRLGAGLLSFLFVYLVLALHQFSGWFILLPVGTYIGLVIYSMSVYPKEQRALRAVRFYELGLARINGEWVGNGNPGTSFADSSEPLCERSRYLRRGLGF